MSRLQEQYKKEILPKLKKELGVSNSMSVPKIEKITINMGPVSYTHLRAHET